jgi:hypothetical protein
MVKYKLKAINKLSDVTAISLFAFLWSSKLLHNTTITIKYKNGSIISNVKMRAIFNFLLNSNPHL